MIPEVPDLDGTRVTVMGLGLQGGGTGVTKYLVRRGAEVTVTDLEPREQLSESVEEIDHLDVNFVLGTHREEDFTSADLVIVNPAVPGDSKYLRLARRNGVPLESELNLFVKQCPAPVIGITGTAGKSTTTAMTGCILRQRPDRETWVGGNIGRSLLPDLDRISADDRVVLEISSFQLLHLDKINWSPSAAVITNISPNHLDRHGTYENYKRAKRTILSHQEPDDLAVLNEEDDVLSTWKSETAGERLTFSRSQPVQRGAWVQHGTVHFRSSAGDPARPMFDVPEIPVPGRFNVENALAAVCAAAPTGMDADEIRSGIKQFEPLPHHLEVVAEREGRTYVDDSVSTTPESTIEALSALADHRLVPILGGYDKGAAFHELAREVCERTAGAVLIGNTAPRIEAALREVDPDHPVRRSDSLEEAVETAEQLLNGREGTILLSPACASYDMFRNYRERGKTFRNTARRSEFSC